MTKIAINGFGRIGRLTLRRILSKHPQLEVAAINDLAPDATMKHLLKYDSSYGIFNKRMPGQILTEENPEKLPWQELGVLLVLECTGVFRDSQGAGKHLKAGAKKVIISAPAKSEEIPTYLLGVNEDGYQPKKDKIVSMGSCTTNALAPVAKVLDKEFGIEKGLMTTVHSYTNDQRILDLAHKDLRRARAAGLNIVPTTTGAAKTVEKCLPQLKDKLDGVALRVPVATVSIVDFVCQVKKQTTAEEVNHILKKASSEEGFKGILGIEDAPLVSSDYKGNSFSAIVDADSTMAQGNLIKVLIWYDNEWAYACRLAEFAEYVAGK